MIIDLHHLYRPKAYMEAISGFLTTSNRIAPNELELGGVDSATLSIVVVFLRGS